MASSSNAWNRTLHWGDLVGFSTSCEDQTATISVYVEHLRLPDGSGSRFTLVLESVMAVNMAQWECPEDLENSDLDKREQALRRARTVSIAVEDISYDGLLVDRVRLYKLKAGALLSPHLYWSDPDSDVRLVTFEIDGSASAVGDYAIDIVFLSAQFYRNGEPITAEEFIRVGKSFWRKFADASAAHPGNLRQ